jgi:hypothetical protein
VEFTDNFKAYGHMNITLKHRTTIMLTTDHKLTLKGDCIAAVSSVKGLSNLNPELKEAVMSENARITMKLEAKGKCFEIHGYGHPDLTWEDPMDIVARKSDYICPRTLMIKADYASIDVPREFVKILRDGLQQVDVTITVNL